MFNLGNVEEKQGGEGKAKFYTLPGVRRVIIKGWESGKSPNGIPFISVKLITPEAEEAKMDVASDFQFYMSEKAQAKSMEKIKHIMTKVTTNDSLNKSVTSLEEFVTLLNSLSTNKEYRQKFTGQEYIQTSSGDKKTSANIGLPSFAEAVHPGAEYPPVKDEDTKLVYDPNNEWDLKKLDIEPTQEEVTDAMSDNDSPDWVDSIS